MTECLERVDLPIRPSYVSAIDVKSVQIKIKKKRKNVTKIRNVCKRNKKTLPLLSVVQRCWLRGRKGIRPVKN